MKFFDAFSGYGGFHLGIERAYENKSGGEYGERTRVSQCVRHIGDSTDSEKQSRKDYCCIGYSEIDKYASAVYKYHFGGKNYGDITKINEFELPDFDLFCGGFPCQSFSIAGKRGGFEDTRGTLIFQVFRILQAKQPRFVLLENVKGLLSHDSGRTFKVIISSLAELGYSVEWQVLNAKNFGVPQNRERVFIIGHLGGFGGRQVFPISRSDQEIIETKELCEQNSNCLRTNYSNGFSNETYVGETIPVLTPDRKEKRQNGRRFKTDGEPMFTLNTQDKHGVYDGYKIRRLTPTECERLMGLPDGWTAKGDFGGEIKEISDTQRYKLCGNGVVVNVVEEIIKRLLTLEK